MASARRFSALLAAGALLALAPAADAVPRNGSGADANEGLGTNRDIAQVRTSYEPATGRFDFVVRFQQPVAAAPRGTVEVYFREDDSGACAERSSDVRFRFDPDPATDGESGAVVAAAAIGSPAFADKRTSPDGLEVTGFFTDSRLATLDMRCTYAQTTDAFTGDPSVTPAVFDRLDPPFYFAGFEPLDTTDPTLRLRAAATQRLGRTGALSVAATSNEAGRIEAIAAVRVARRSVPFRASVVSSTTPGTEYKLKLRLSRTNLSKVRKALAGGARLTARVEVTAEDAAGNSTSQIRKIRLKP
jgi:hypothetical protein